MPNKVDLPENNLEEEPHETSRLMKFGEPLSGGDWTLYKGTDLIGRGDREGVKDW